MAVVDYKTIVNIKYHLCIAMLQAIYLLALNTWCEKRYLLPHRWQNARIWKLSTRWETEKNLFHVQDNGLKVSKVSLLFLSFNKSESEEQAN